MRQLSVEHRSWQGPHPFLQCLFLFFSSLLISCKARTVDNEFRLTSGGNETVISPKSIVQKYTIPLAEVSGLAWRFPTDHSQKLQLLAVGDHEFDLAIADASDILNSSNFSLQRLEKPRPSKTNAKSSWEAIASDAIGDLFILEETPGALHIFDREGKHLKQSIELNLANSLPSNLSQSWEQEDNSRGEGLLLMKQGHFLVLKEKAPCVLIEFGPAGDLPLGVSESSLLGGKEPFDLSSGNSYVPLRFWNLNIKDGSELIRHPTKPYIYVLSDQMRSIFQIESCPNIDGAECVLGKRIKLPDSMEKIEGAVIDPHGNLIVASDLSDDQKVNLFILSASAWQKVESF